METGRVTYVVTFVLMFIVAVDVRESSLQFTIPRINARPGKAWFEREGRSLLLPCLLKTPADTDKYAKATYVWRDGHDKGMLRSRTMIFGNGSLYIEHLLSGDTDTYYCDVFLPDDTKDTSIHNVIVYGLAKFYMANPFVYTTASCDERVINRKYSKLMAAVCKHYSEDRCPFRGRKDCYQRRLSEVDQDITSDALYALKITIEQHPKRGFKLPECGFFCMKKAMVEHLQNNGDDVLTELTYREDRSKSSEFKTLHFEKHELYRRQIVTRCRSGYEIYHRLICVPCTPGTFVRYEYSYHESSSPRCTACPVGYFQDKYGMDECIHCPTLYYESSLSEAATSCPEAQFDISYYYDLAYATGAVCVLFFGCCTIRAARRRREEQLTGAATSDVSEAAVQDLLKTFENETHNNNPDETSPADAAAAAGDVIIDVDGEVCQPSPSPPPPPPPADNRTHNNASPSIDDDRKRRDFDARVGTGQPASRVPSLYRQRQPVADNKRNVPSTGHGGLAVVPRRNAPQRGRSASAAGPRNAASAAPVVPRYSLDLSESLRRQSARSASAVGARNASSAGSVGRAVPRHNLDLPEHLRRQSSDAGVPRQQPRSADRPSRQPSRQLVVPRRRSTLPLAV